MSFTVSIGRLVDKAKGNIDLAVRQAVVLAAQGIVLDTPVDTGRARGNWVLGVNRIDATTSANTDKSGEATIRKIANGMPRAAAGGIYYITNSLPYIQRLEDGYSQKAPSGMVKTTVAALPAAIERFARTLA